MRGEEAHGNRELFLDDVFLAYLLAFFNPTLRSLRTIDEFSQTQQAQRHLSTSRICKNTLSEFNRFADAERLQPIMTELRGALSRKFAGRQRPADLHGLLKQVLAVDGTSFAADVAWAVGHRNQSATRYRARLDVQIDVRTWLPEVLAAHYEMRGEQLCPRAEFVLRAKTNQLHLTVSQEHSLSDEQRALGILSDRVGRLTGTRANPAPDVVVREVVFLTAEGETVRLLTNLLDVPGEVIAELYRHRWQIELFFRWLMCYAHFDHLTSHSRSGVLLNFYVVIIGVLLMYLHTGGHPSKYALALLGVVAQSGGSLESILPILWERERQCERDRKGAAIRREQKKAEGR